MTDTEKLRAKLTKHLPMLDSAAIPTKSEVFVLCGYEARELHDALSEASTLLDRISSLEAEVSTLLAGADADAFMISDLTAKRASLEGENERLKALPHAITDEVKP